MALSPSGGGEAGYSSLRDAVNRIIGGAPGGTPSASNNLGWSGQGSGAPQTSDVILGQKTGLGTVSGVENTPFEDPNVTAQKKAVADAQAVTAGMQSQLNSSATPAAAITTAPAVKTTSLGTMGDLNKVTGGGLPNQPQMISKAALYELQKQQQMQAYDASKAQQLASLKSQGVSDWQLRGASGPTNWKNALPPANWGSMTNYMNSTMVENPYYRKA
jgi:hypothetical protein